MSYLPRKYEQWDSNFYGSPVHHAAFCPSTKCPAVEFPFTENGLFPRGCPQVHDASLRVLFVISLTLTGLGRICWLRKPEASSFNGLPILD